MNSLGMLLAEKPLTDLFYTEAFSGSWAVFSKFNFLGYVMQFFISASALIALFLISYQRLMTLVYLSSRPLFDRVHELKQHGKGQKFLGLPSLASNTLMTANHGTGFDAILSFALSLLPDVKSYSDYNEERMAYNLQEDDSITTYLLKVSIPTIMTIFFFSICFNGVMFKAYGNVVDAMGVAANNFVEADLSSQVQKWVNAGGAYQFGHDADGTEYGKFKQNLAKDIYAKVLRKSDDLSAGAKQYIGKQIDKYVNGLTLQPGQVGTLSVPGFNGEADDCKNLEYSVVINSTEKYENAETQTIATLLGTAVSANAAKQYLHVFIAKKNNADETNYFEIDKDKVSSDGTDNPTSSTQLSTQVPDK